MVQLCRMVRVCRRKQIIILFLSGIQAMIHASSAATLNINNSVQIYNSLSDTIVSMAGRSELHLTHTAAPMSGCQINLTSFDSWLFLDAIKPSVVAAEYLGQIQVCGQPADLDVNIRIVQYGKGAVVIPHGPQYQPLQVFDGVCFSGDSKNLGLYTCYRDDQLGQFNNAVRSFKLKHGYMAAFAQESNGTGISRIYIAKDSNLQIGMMPPELNNTVSFIRVFPWRWTVQKGWSGGDNKDATTLNCAWRYDWNNTAESTLDVEYVPMRHNRYWNSYENINNKMNSTHVLGFNEPEVEGKNFMTVNEVISQWPNLLESGLRLGSPVTTDGNLGWLYEFIDQADALNYRVDFVAVHYYKNNWSADQMYNWLYAIYKRTGRPLWITEWNNGCDWTKPDPTYRQNADKIRELLNMMAHSPFVERYAIYQWCDNRELIRPDGGLTPAGIVYRDHVSSIANVMNPNKTYIGYYRLDETQGTTAADLSGNQMHAALKNGLSFDKNSVSGKIGSGLCFDGKDDYIQLPAGFDEFDNGFSIAFWAKPTAVKNGARFIDFGGGADGNNIILTRIGTTGTLAFQTFSGNSDGSAVSAPNAIDLDVWQFLAAAVDNFGNVRIYKNGKLIQTGVSAAPASVRRTNNYIGRSNSSSDAYYQGDLDDIHIFNYALSENEISALYTNSAFSKND